MSAPAARRVPAERLHQLVKSLFLAKGVPEADAECASGCLVWSNLHGIDTHGVIRAKFYLDRLGTGGNNPRPDIRVVRESPVAAVLDGDNALGPVGGTRAMRLAIAKAGKAGVGIVAIRRSNHYGPCAYYTLMATPRDMIGVSMTNVLASMPPTGGREARLGNNPFSIAIPAGAEPPVVLDYATSLSSWGKVYTCKQKGEPLPEGCFLDREGRPTVKPDDVMAGGLFLPIASYKGYGIALAIALLTGVLSEGAFDAELSHPYKAIDKPGDNAFLMAAARVDQFQPTESFKKRVDEVVRAIRSTPRAPGVERIYLPGDLEREAAEDRSAHGIPLNEKQLTELKEMADKAGVPWDL